MAPVIDIAVALICSDDGVQLHIEISNSREPPEWVCRYAQDTMHAINCTLALVQVVPTSEVALATILESMSPARTSSTQRYRRSSGLLHR